MNAAIPTLLLATGVASAQLVVEYNNDFTGVEGDTGETFLDRNAIEFVGNGDEGAGYWDNNRAALAFQSYGSRQVEAAVGSFQLNGVTLQAGTEYTITATVTESPDTWNTARNVFFGISDAANRPTTPDPFAANPMPGDLSPGQGIFVDEAFNEIELPLNDDTVEGPFNDIQWTFTPSTTYVEPLFVFGTEPDDTFLLFLDSRFRLFEVTITSGEDTGSTPGCAISDIAAPFGVIDLADVDAFIASFLSGCP